MSIRSVVILLAIAIVIGVVTLSPIQVAYSLSAYGKIVPVRKWALTKGTDGQLTALLFNYKSGISEGYNTAQFAREGTMQFTFSPSIIAGGVVAAGETVGTIHSSETAVKLADLMGQLAIARADLQAATTGEKGSAVDECRQRLEWTKGRASQKQKELARLKTLSERNLISQEDYEAAESEVYLLGIEVSVAKAQLATATSGKKPDEIELINARIHALEGDIAAIRDLIKSFSITAPFAGKIARVAASDTLLTIHDTSTFLAIIPILYIDRTHVREGQQIVVEADDVAGEVYGYIAALDNEVRILNGREVLMGVANLAVLPEGTAQGKIAQCTIHCEPVNLLEYVRRFFSESVL